MLNVYLTEQIPVTVLLQNKIRVSGRVKAFDSYVIVVEGEKHEILYRHAVSSIAPSVQEEQKRLPSQITPAPAKTTARPQKAAAQKPRSPQIQAPLSMPPTDHSINNGMKEGLLKWMQEQKAAR